FHFPGNSSNFIKLDNDKIHCIPNPSLITFMDSANKIISLPVCNSNNNNSNCSIHPKIFGKVFVDINSNGIKDKYEVYKPDMHLTLSNGNKTFSTVRTDYNWNTDLIDTGFYEFIPDTLGT